MNQKKLFIGAALLLLAAFFVGIAVYTAKQGDEATQHVQSNREALLRPHAYSIGKVDAPVVIVEFFDPACETCRMFYPRVKELMAQHPDKIRLVLRYAAFHEGSDKVVALLEAARKQNKFMPTLEALLANQNEWVQHHRADVTLVWKPLEGVGLNMEQMAYDMTAPEIQQVLKQDAEDARILNVTKTPEFFVNGRPLPRFGWEPLVNLVDEELAKAK